MPSADNWPGFQGHARRIREKDERPERTASTLFQRASPKLRPVLPGSCVQHGRAMRAFDIPLSWGELLKRTLKEASEDDVWVWRLNSPITSSSLFPPSFSCSLWPVSFRSRTLSTRRRRAAANRSCRDSRS